MVTAWKVSKCGVFSGPYFLAFRPEKTPYLDTFHAVYSLYIIQKIWFFEQAKDSNNFFALFWASYVT